MNPSLPAPALAVEDVSVAFAGVQALARVSFAARAGEVLGLIGPNGAGKTTLFDVISGLRRPDAGRVVLAGVDITGRGAVRRSRHGLRRTFQRQQVFSTLSAEDNVLSAVEWRGGGGGILADMVRLPPRRALERRRRQGLQPVLTGCGIATVAATPAGGRPHGSGSARMVELARAIADTPGVVLLDEPTSGLDEREVDRLGGQIQDLRARGDCAVLLIEHDIEFVMAQCDRIVALESGTVIAEGTVDEIRSDPAVQNAYLS
jgi:branched-chain amino acid transport system ATP-binding protein